MEMFPLASQINQQLIIHDIHIAVGEAEDRILLSGRVHTKKQRDEAEQIARKLAPDKKVDNLLEVARPSDNTPPKRKTSSKQGIEIIEDNNTNPDFTEQPLETNPINVADDTVLDLDQPAEPDPAYFPSTDPVITSNRTGSIDILGGFEATSMDDMNVAKSVENNLPGDEALIDAIQQELHEDALTTDLDITVKVVNRVAYLHGNVPSLEDVDDVEDVASRVPGVRDVIEELNIVGF